ncbi:MAG: BspA family leucine-rich repeat surface protein, partial [Oscillibacter sp.]|nr:BspA family leucine-rich repeat surface protein [Oscillibacter sp.]
MKKHVLGMIAALFVFAVLLPATARAANTAYAILYDDGTLVFQNSETPEPGRKANRRYTFDLTAVYTQASKVPWYEERQILRTVDFAEKISPISTAYWFYNCIQLQRIDNIQNLDTANTTNMSHMFYSCTHIEELDLSNFDTAKVTDMEQMFWGCLRLKVIYASSKFTTASLKSKLRSQNSNDTMFNGCKVLVGGNGTQFKTTYKDTNYARIDTLDTPGYFTAKESDPTPVPSTYTVIWQNYDGAILKADTNVSAGTFPAYSGATPTRIGHTFTGWSPQPSAVTGNVTYTATFEAVSSTYTVIWQNYDGTILKADTDVSAGTFPTYSGATPTRT